MATGRVASTQVLAADGNKAVYTVPAGYYGVYNISLTNTTVSAMTIRIAIGATSSPANSEFIEMDTAIVAKGVFERTGIVVSANQVIIVSASAGTAGLNTALNCNVYGIETSTA
jgi:hypothetical protein